MPNPKLPRGRCLNCNKELPGPHHTYCNNDCYREYVTKLEIGQIEHDGFVSCIQQARRYFKRTQHHHCGICKQTSWQGQPIPLLIDHIDGNSMNWSLNNLRRICPNCDALLPTYKGRNRGNGRAARRERYTAGKSY